MRDYISKNRVANLHPKIREEVAHLIDVAETQFPSNMAIRVVQGLRTIDEQNGLYALGRTKVNPDGKSPSKPMGNIVTKAVGGKSYHNYGLAIDFAILKDINGDGVYETLSWNTEEDFDKDGKKDWSEVVKVFTNGGYEWGGNWVSIKDNPHFQKSFGLSIEDLLKMYNNKQIIAGTPYLKF